MCMATFQKGCSSTCTVLWFDYLVLFLHYSEVPTTRRPFAETTTARQVTTTPSRPKPAEPRRDGRVKCFVCGSLFSTDAPDCQAFDLNHSAQQKTCEKGEACLWYSYQKSSDEKAVIRECFSSSILLGMAFSLHLKI